MGAVVIALGVAFFVIGFLISVTRNLPSIDDLSKYQPYQTTTIYSSDGHVIGLLFKENRIWVPLSRIPLVVRQALLASEDSRFYQHHGVDVVSIIRAAIANFREGRITQGGSTITQQLARQLFLTDEVSFERKIKEAILALQIERQYSKDEILEIYLNIVYFGEGAYGIEMAARTYFNKHASQLTLPEAAMLIGLLPAPSTFSPFNNYKLARQRQLYVLSRMLELGYITPSQYKSAVETKLKFNQNRMDFHTYKYPYFTLYALDELMHGFNIEQVMRAGLNIYTSLDIGLQEYAQKVVREVIDDNISWSNAHQAALVLIENKTGYIRAMVGGYQFTESNQFNRAWQAQRQPGSAFKIFVYTTAILEGWRPDSVVRDEKVRIKLPDGKYYVPRNWDNKYWGKITLREAFIWSRNTTAVWLAHQVGIEKVIEVAKAMGIRTELEPYPSLALGSGVVRVIDMATAVSVIANDGYLIHPKAIVKITDRNGTPVYIATTHSEQILPAETARMMKDLMFDVVRRGTGGRVYTPKFKFAGKTGTTNDYRDAWFVGFSPHYSCAVWMGNDDYKPMNHVYGGTLPAEIWKKVMIEAESKIR